MLVNFAEKRGTQALRALACKYCHLFCFYSQQNFPIIRTFQNVTAKIPTMSDQRKNFWVILTLFALTFATLKWIEEHRDRSRSHCQVKQIELKQERATRPHTPCRSMYSRHQQAQRTPAIDDFIFVHEEPKAVNLDQVRDLMGYPPLAKEAGLEGRVLARVLVDEQGNYLRHRIINQPHPVLRSHTERYLRELRFSPALRDGRALRFWVNIPFDFQL